jgi:hypothetical protein
MACVNASIIALLRSSSEWTDCESPPHICTIGCIRHTRIESGIAHVIVHGATLLKLCIK